MAHVVDLENAAAKLTGTVNCINDSIKELKKCRMCKEHIESLIEKATKLLDAKELILTSQLKSIQEFRGKRKEPGLLFDDEASKRARMEESAFEAQMRGFE